MPIAIRPPLFVVWGCLVFAPLAQATLGEPLPPTDRQASPAKQSARQAQTPLPYTAHTTTDKAQLVVTQYATLQGRVFAVQWKGPTLPPLEVLLGKYFQTFRAQVDASHEDRGVGSPVVVDHGHLKLFSGGRTGRFAGYAYDPRMVPFGVEISNVLQ